MWLLSFAVFPPITMATISGVRGVREERINAALSLGASRRQCTITHVALPSTLPEVASGIRIAGPWLRLDHCGRREAQQRYSGGSVALPICPAPSSRPRSTIACIIVIGIAAILLDLAIKGLENVLVPWRGKSNEGQSVPLDPAPP